MRIAITQMQHDQGLVDRSGAACSALSVRWECEADRPDRVADGADAGTIAGPVPAVHRYRRGVRRDWPAPARTLAHSTNADSAGCLWAGDHHDRRDGGHSGRWW